MTIDMRDHIHESNLIEGIDSRLEDAQSYIAWRWLNDQHYIDHEVICRLQRLIVQNQTDLAEPWKGVYRSEIQINVTVGPHRAPDWSQVQQLMDVWVAELHDHTPWWNHAEFETIHPFADGNGRTGRMLMWWQQMRLGDEPELFEAQDRMAYYQWLQSHRKEVGTT